MKKIVSVLIVFASAFIYHFASEKYDLGLLSRALPLIMLILMATAYISSINTNKKLRKEIEALKK